MTSPQARADEDFALLERVLARRKPEEQIGLLSTSLRCALERKYTLQADNKACSAALGEVQKELARVRLESIADQQCSANGSPPPEGPTECRERLRRATAELATVRKALIRAEEDRRILLATIVEHIRASAHGVADRDESPVRARGKSSGGLLPQFFRDEAQADRAISGVLRTMGLDQLWGEQGLSRAASALLDTHGTLSSSERAMLLAACDLCGRRTGLAFSTILEHLRGAPLRALMTLVLAAIEGPDAVDRWLLAGLDHLLTVRG